MGATMGATNGSANAATAGELVTAALAAIASERSLAACFLRIRSSRSEMGGFTNDVPLRVDMFC